MDDSEDLKKIDEIIKKHKIESQDPDELEYAEFIDYTDNNEADDIIEIDDYEIPDFPKSDFTKFHDYTPTHLLTDEEKGIVESCSDPDLKQLLLLNRNKNIQLMQLYKKIKDLLEECQQNISMKEEYVSTAKISKRVCNRIWRLGIPYFKTKDDFPCPRNEDIIRKHNNGELLFYDMTPSNKWLEKDMNRLFKGVGFHYKTSSETELEKRIKQLEKEISEGVPDAEKEELVQELKNNLEDIKNTETVLFPPLGCDKNLDWNRIAEYFLRERYSAQDCQIFWNTYLNPEINKGPWTQEENEKLKRLAAEYNCQNWDLIAAELGNNRTGFIACVHYFCKIDPPRQGRFTAEEDKLLCELVEQYKQGEYVPWTKIAHHFKERTRGQLFYRYKYFLSCRSGKVRGKFSEAEDILVLVLVDRFGKKFTKCGQYFPHRTVVQIKARYSSNLKGAIKKGSFTIDEDHEILEYVKKNGTSSWEPLVRRLNRCGGQIRQRYKTLTAFLKAHPEMDLKKAPRRKFTGISFDTEYDFLRCMADRFKHCEKIPTLQDIEKLLARNPKPKPVRLDPKEKSAHPRRQKEDKEKTAENHEKQEKNIQKSTQNKKKLTEKKDKKKAEGILSETQKGSTKKIKNKSPPPLLLSEDDSDIEKEFPEVYLSVDNLLVDFFSNSIKLHFEQNVTQAHIHRAADSVLSVLSTLEVELYIPTNFEEDSRLDAIDLDILKILTSDTPVNMEKKYVINRNSMYIERLIPPNLNTVVGMRSLLIKNQIYKSKHAKRAHIFENFRPEYKEKQVLWCINKHLSNQSPDTQMDLISERNLFFRRFVSLFKFPAIMTLQKPSELLESTSKTWKNEFTAIVKTYKKKTRPTLTQDNKDGSAFESVFIKQQPHEQEEYESNARTSYHNHFDEVGMESTIIEQLKRKISDTIDELKNSPPVKKYYPDHFKTIPIQYTPRKKAAIDHANIEWRKMYIRKKNKPAVSKTTSSSVNAVDISKSGNKNKVGDVPAGNVINIKTENVQNLYPDESESQSSFNLSRGELVLENDSPCDSTNSSLSQAAVADQQISADDNVESKKTYKRKIKSTPVITSSASSSVNTVVKSMLGNKNKIGDIPAENIINIKTEYMQDLYPGESESHSSFNLSRGELILENDSPCDSVSNSWISQDLKDLNVLNAFLKKEKNVIEESFDF